MQLTTNEHGKPFWIEVEEESLVIDENFHEVNMSNKFFEELGEDPNIQFAFHCNLGSITVLDRMTGFGFGVRDTETGYRDPDGKFWLASGMFNIRDHMPMQFADAVKLIKQNANNCVGE